MFLRPAVEEGTAMTRLILSLLAAIAPTPALAGERLHNFSQIAVVERAVGAGGTAGMGVRISNDVGFQLIEHGQWAPRIQPQVANATARIDRQIKAASLKSRSPQKKLSSQMRRAAYLPYVYAAEAKFALPSGLLDALIWTESRYNPFAISKAGAAGLGQLMPGTAKDLGVANRFDPYVNILGAGRYLRQMLDRFGMVHLALAAYNAGPGAIDRKRGIPANGETPAYVLKVLARWRAS
jgi:soluble lytic murein transglycosylase-like protein